MANIETCDTIQHTVEKMGHIQFHGGEALNCHLLNRIRTLTIMLTLNLTLTLTLTPNTDLNPIHFNHKCKEETDI